MRKSNLTDIPPLTNWNNAVIGKFYRPIKKSLTIRLDADVLAWLRGQGKGYQTRLNALLREAMDAWLQVRIKSEPPLNGQGRESFMRSSAGGTRTVNGETARSVFLT